MSGDSRVLAWSIALLAGCPVLINLAGTFVRDGDSFVITTGSSVAILGALFTVVALRGASLAWSSELLLFAGISAVFWLHYLTLALLCPSLCPEPVMRMLPFYAALWIVTPLCLALLTRHAVDSGRIFHAMVVLMAVYVGLTLVRYLLGLGTYHAGRWNPGASLEAIRAGRYAAAALFVFLVAAIAPAVTPRIRLTAMLALGPALFLTLVANARGPWLALFAALATAGIPLAAMLVRRIREDARVAFIALLFAGSLIAGLALSLGSAESNFMRLIDPTQDGGSADGRGALLMDYITLLNQHPSAWFTGLGYGHDLFYPHNILVEMISVGGLPMLALFLCVIALTVARGVSLLRRGDAIGMTFFGLFALGLTGSQFSGSLGNELMPWFMSLLVLIRAEDVANEESPEEPVHA